MSAKHFPLKLFELYDITKLYDMNNQMNKASRADLKPTAFVKCVRNEIKKKKVKRILAKTLGHMN